MAGRSSCHEGYLEEAREYIQGGYEANGEVIPTMSGLAVHLGVARDTVINWAKQESNKHREEWQYISEWLKAVQEVKLINKSLLREFDSTISRLILSTNHGYNEKSRVDHVSSDGSMTPKATIDVTKLSTKALEELVNAQSDAD